MSASRFPAGRCNPVGPASGYGAVIGLRRLFLRLGLALVLAAAVGGWIRYELPAAMDNYTLFD